MSTLSAALATVYAASAQRNADAHRILSSSTFFAPLTHSLALTRGSGSPTFTRATTATVFDNEGKLITVPSGASRHVGARYVRNLLSFSEDFSNGYWTKLGTCTVTGTNQINMPAANDGLYKTSISVSPGNFVVAQVKLSGSGTIVFALRNGSGGTWIADPTITLTSTPTIYTVSGTVGAGVTTVEVYIRRLSGTTATTVVATEIQLENVTGQADQTASEYVSVGVLSAPYHGLGVDGIKAFQTHKSGAPIAASSLEGYLSEPAATNNLLYCRDLLAGAKVGAWVPSTTGAAVLSDDFSSYADDAALNAAWSSGNATLTISSGKIRVTTTTGGSNSYASRAITTVAGKTYKLMGTLSTDATSGGMLLRAGTTAGSGDLGSESKSAVGEYSVTFVASGTTTHISALLDSSSTSGQYAEFDNITVYEAAIVPTLTATGIDGAANSATTLTAAADNATILQPRTLASAARSSSAYIKRRTGSGNVYFTRDGGTTWTDITASLSTSAWYRAKIENSSVTNPSVGFKLATSGDAIDVDYVQDEANVIATSPIATTTATVTRNADYLVYPNTGNVTDAAATAYCKHRLFTATPAARRPITFSASNNNRAQMHADQSTGYFTGYFGTGSGSDYTTPGIAINTTQKRSAIAWTNGAKGKACINGGNVNKTTSNVSVITSAIAIGATVGGGNEGVIVRDVHVFSSELSDNNIKVITK